MVRLFAISERCSTDSTISWAYSLITAGFFSSWISWANPGIQWRGLLTSWATEAARVPRVASFSVCTRCSRSSCSSWIRLHTNLAAFPLRLSTPGGLRSAISAVIAGSPVTSTMRSAPPLAISEAVSVEVGMLRRRACCSPGAFGLLSATPTILTPAQLVNSSIRAAPPFPAPSIMTLMGSTEAMGSGGGLRAGSIRGPTAVHDTRRRPLVPAYRSLEFEDGALFESSFDCPEQLLSVNRFDQIVDDSLLQQGGAQLEVGVSGLHDNRDGRILSEEVLDGLHAVDPGHADIADNDIHHQRIFPRIEDLDGLAAIFSLLHVIAGLGQSQAHNLSYILLVVHHQHTSKSRGLLCQHSKRPQRHNALLFRMSLSLSSGACNWKAQNGTRATQG